MPDEGLITSLRRLKDDSQRKMEPTPLGRLVSFRGVFELVTLADAGPGVEVRNGSPYLVGPQGYSTAHGRATSIDLESVITEDWPISTSAGMFLTDVFDSTGGPNAREVGIVQESLVS